MTTSVSGMWSCLSGVLVRALWLVRALPVWPVRLIWTGWRVLARPKNGHVEGSTSPADLRLGVRRSTARSWEEHNAVQGRWDGGLPGHAAPMPATTTATPASQPSTANNLAPTPLRSVTRERNVIRMERVDRICTVKRLESGTLRVLQADDEIDICADFYEKLVAAEDHTTIAAGEGFLVIRAENGTVRYRLMEYDPWLSTWKAQRISPALPGLAGQPTNVRRDAE